MGFALFPLMAGSLLDQPTLKWFFIMFIIIGIMGLFLSCFILYYDKTHENRLNKTAKDDDEHILQASMGGFKSRGRVTFNK